jgi:hypothetical protein
VRVTAVIAMCCAATLAGLGTYLEQAWLVWVCIVTVIVSLVLLSV